MYIYIYNSFKLIKSPINSGMAPTKLSLPDILLFICKKK